MSSKTQTNATLVRAMCVFLAWFRGARPTSLSWTVLGCICTLMLVCTNTVAAAGDQIFASGMEPLAELRVSRFGSGAVQADQGGLTCQGSECIARYEVGSTVRLSAMPIANSALHQWSGCDNVQGNQCLIDLQGSRQANAYFVRDVEPIVNNDVVVLDQETLDQLIAVSGDQIWLTNTAQAQTLAVGNIVISDRDGGFARRITSVSTDLPPYIILAVEDAALEELFDEVAFMATLPENQRLEIEHFTAAPGISITRSRANTFTFHIEVEIPEQTPIVKIDGTLEFEQTPEFAIDISGRKLRELKLAYGQRIKFTGEIGHNMAGIGSEVEIGLFTFSPMVVFIGPVPVTIRPVVNLYASGKTSTIVPYLDFDVDYELQGTAGFYWAQGQGVSPIYGMYGGGSSQLDSGFTVSAFASEAEIGIKAMAKIYEVAGPYVRTGLHAEAEVEWNDLQCFQFASKGVLDIALGGQFKLFGMGFELEFVEYAKELFSLTHPIGGKCDDAPAPRTPVMLPGQATEHGITVLWSVPEMSTYPGNVGLRFEIIRDGIIVNNISGTSYLDADVARGLEYCYRVRATNAAGKSSIATIPRCIAMTYARPDGPGPLTPVLQQPTPGPGGMSIRWNQPSGVPTNSDPVSFEIRRNDAALETIWAGTGPNLYLDAHVQTGTTYCYTVTAIDANGRGTMSPRACAQMPGSGSNGRLNDTGITWSRKSSGSNSETCNASDPIGQDCHHGRDSLAAAGQLQKIGGSTLNNGIENGLDYTKISNSGNELPASALLGSGPNDWACTRDNVTGLIWEVKVDDAAHLRHQSHRYTWRNPASPDGNPGSLGTVSTCNYTLNGQPCNTHNYVLTVNAQGLCGANNWRMPAQFELQNIVDYGRHRPAIDINYFPNTPNRCFWSGSPDATNHAYALGIDFMTGESAGGHKTIACGVRLVRFN